MDQGDIRNKIIVFLKNGLNQKDWATTIDEIINSFQVSATFQDRDKIHEEIHLLLINNILMRAPRWGIMPNWYNLKLTEYGKTCLKTGNIIPLDPEGYLQEVKKTLPQLDSVILEYLGESIAAFNKNLPMASTITLGVASEQAMFLLIDSFCSYIKDSNLRNYIDKLEKSNFIATKYDIFKEAIDKLPNEVKKELPENYDTTIDMIFNFIKINRDKTGHPRGGGKDKLIQGASLQAFRGYIVIIYKLIDYFKDKKLSERSILK